MTGTLVYDGDCAFCTWSAQHGRRVLPASVELVPWQRADLPALGLDRAAVQTAVQWVAPGRGPQAGHRAIAAWLIASGWPWSLGGRLLLLPPVSWLAAGVYHVVSRNRHRIPGPWRRNGTACGVPTRGRDGRRG
jgi:predicted DCC family thiol-disulfide oxidoreductase YuxK